MTALQTLRQFGPRAAAAIPSMAPVEQVAKMDAAAYFARFAELTKDSPPHANDYPVLARMYDDKQFFTDNPINRYAIGDRDKLTFNDDGSLTLYVQRESPGKDKENNWLPAPKEGGFSMNLRLYWPKPQALDGTGKPPAVK